jgi:hypothetical protein
VKRHFLTLGALIAALVAFALPATADQAVAPAAVAPDAAAPVVAQAASPAPSPSPTAPPKPFQWGAYADAGYTNASTFGPHGFIADRVFDNVSGVPQFQDLNLTTSYMGPALGAKIELNYGTDAVVIHSYPMSPTLICPGGLNGITPTCTAPYNPQLDFTQGYLSYTVGKFTLIAGKFETLAGAEVIESPNDLEYSRSILFGQIPFTHTGARLTFAATPTLSLIVGGNRGWDTVYGLSAATEQKLGAPAGFPADTGSLTAELGVAYNPSSVFSLTMQGYIGSQEDWFYAGCATNSNCTRSLFDAVGTYHIDSNLTAIVNVDSASQAGTCSSSFATGVYPYCGLGVGTVNWGGVAGYLSEAWNSNLTTTVRYEHFGDPEGYRTGIGGTAWNELTGTLQFAPGSNAIFRAEVRVDTANQPIFSTVGGMGAQKLYTFGLEAIGHFP